MSIDWWTLGLQALNVLVLVWLLQRVFWRPVAGVIAERRRQVGATVEAAEARRAEAEAALAEVARTREGFAQEREEILAAARKEAEAATAATEKAAEAERRRAREAAEAAEARAAQAREKARDQAAAELAVDIARRLLERVDGARVQSAFLDRLVAALGEMSPEARRAAARDGEALELATATPLDAEARARVAEAVGEALGGRPRLAFRTDPALIAGARLQGPHFTLSDDWRADLDRIKGELSDAR